MDSPELMDVDCNAVITEGCRIESEAEHVLEVEDVVEHSRNLGHQQLDQLVRPVPSDNILRAVSKISCLTRTGRQC